MGAQLGVLRDASIPVKAIVGANVAVFALYHLPRSVGPIRDRVRSFFREHMLLSWENIRKGNYMTIIGSMFVHNDPWHLFGNLSTLISFAPFALSILSPYEFVGL